ncbi:MAG: carboxypeptidase-like regulatory domain-containing protein, partial [Proteobacteria bacterium]|nr:carboxypeptidase-like regulatory domain-containing protein [Pseudomonadota bacterium]
QTGAPVAAADVRVVVRGHTFWRAQRQAFTGADGTFTIGGLPRRAVDVVASHASGASAIASLELDKTRDGTVTLKLDLVGAIDGLVVDTAGQPIGDAQVIAEPEFDGGITDRQAWSVRGVAQTLTDQGGAFRFPGLPAGTYRVRAARPGAAEVALDLARSTIAKPGDKLKLVVPADGKIVGKVVMADGKPPTSFSVSLAGGYATPFATADGAFALPAVAGTHTLVVDGKSFLTARSKDVTVTEGKPTDVGTITVQPGRSISGRVVDETGTPVAGAKVAVGTLLTGGGTELYIADESINAKDTDTDAQGRFVLDGFPPTSLTAIAGKADVRSASVRLSASADSSTLVLVLQKTTGLDGKITRDGKPLGDTIVLASPIGASSTFFVATGPDGTFALDALAAGPYIVYPMIGGGGSRPKDLYVRRVDVASGARAHVEIDATAGATTLTVHAKQGGAPVPMAMVVAVGAKVSPHTAEELRAIDQFAFGDTPTPLHMRMLVAGTVDIDYPRDVLWGFYPKQGVVAPGEDDPNLADASPVAVACAETAYRALQAFIASDPPALRMIVQAGAASGFTTKFYLWTNDYTHAADPY